jgi:hypothetical protein
MWADPMVARLAVLKVDLLADLRARYLVDRKVVQWGSMSVDWMVVQKVDT